MLNQTIQEKQSQQNKSKLIQQNKTLYKQIHQLQIQLNNVLQDPLTLSNKKDLKQNQDNISSMNKILKQQLFQQQTQIKRLKQKVYYLKSSNAKANALYIQKEQNQLLCLKRQKEALEQQKIIMQRGTKDKKIVLQINKNLLQHKTDLEKDFNTAKSYNKQSQLKIVQIQRAIRKYHYINQTNKKNNKTNKDGQNQINNQNLEELAFKISQIEGQTLHQKIDIKKIQEKWKQQLQALDQQYFQIKTMFNKQQIKIQNSQKQMKVIKHRAMGLREQNDIISDRKKFQKMSQSKSFHNQSLIKRVASPIIDEIDESLSKNSKTQFLLTQFSIMKQKAKLIGDTNNGNNISNIYKKSKAIPPTTKFNQIDKKRSYSFHDSKQSIDDIKKNKNKLTLQEPRIQNKKYQKIQKQKSSKKLDSKIQSNEKNNKSDIQKKKLQNQNQSIKIKKQSQRYSKQQNQKKNAQISKINKSQDKKRSQVKQINNRSNIFQNSQLLMQNQIKKNQAKALQSERQKQQIKKSIEQKNISYQKEKTIKLVKVEKVQVKNQKQNNKLYLKRSIESSSQQKQPNTKIIQQKQRINSKSKTIKKEQQKIMQTKRQNTTQKREKKQQFKAQERAGHKLQKSIINKSDSIQKIKNSNKTINSSAQSTKINNNQQNQAKVQSPSQSPVKKQQKQQKQKIQIFISNRKTKKQQKKLFQESYNQKQVIQTKKNQMSKSIHEEQEHNSENINNSQPEVRRVLRKKVSMHTSEMGVGTTHQF